MPAAVDASLFGSIAPEPVNVTVSGLALDDRVTIYREAPGEPRTVVRGGRLAVPTGTGVVLVQDVEAPFGRPVTYVAEVLPAVAAEYVAASAPIVVTDPGRHVFSDPYTGSQVLADVVATDDARETPLRASVLPVQGRARPVALIDTRESDRGEIVAYTRSAAETEALRALLATGSPIVSRESPGRDTPGSEVLLLGDVSRARRTTAGDRLFTLPFVVVDTPDPSRPVSLVNLADLATYYTGETLADVAVDFPGTLLDLARHDLGTA